MYTTWRRESSILKKGMPLMSSSGRSERTIQGSCECQSIRMDSNDKSEKSRGRWGREHSWTTKQPILYKKLSARKKKRLRKISPIEKTTLSNEYQSCISEARGAGDGKSDQVYPRDRVVGDKKDRRRAAAKSTDGEDRRKPDLQAELVTLEQAEVKIKGISECIFPYYRLMP